jgi:hypothetical protein
MKAGGSLSCLGPLRTDRAEALRASGRTTELRDERFRPQIADGAGARKRQPVGSHGTSLARFDSCGASMTRRTDLRLVSARSKQIAIRRLTHTPAENGFVVRFST